MKTHRPGVTATNVAERRPSRSSRRRRRASLLAMVLAAGGLVSEAPPASAAAVQGFVFVGHPVTFTVPPSVFNVDYVVRGAKGGGVGGLGAKVSGTLAVTPGQVLQLNVAGSGGNGGYGGGGPGGPGGGVGDTGGNGGGASDIRVGACAASLSCGSSARVVVAGGGGGGGGDGHGVKTDPGTGGSVQGAPAGYYLFLLPLPGLGPGRRRSARPGRYIWGERDALVRGGSSALTCVSLAARTGFELHLQA